MSDEYFLNLARAVATGAECTRRKAGAVLVIDGKVAATGFNSSQDPVKSCLKGDCPRGKHYRALSKGGPPVDGGVYFSLFGKMCGCGNHWPCPESAIPAKSDYNYGDTRCIAEHAEVAAAKQLTDTSRFLFIPQGALIELYCTDTPCSDCATYLRNAGVARVVTPSGVVNHRENYPCNPPK